MSIKNVYYIMHILIVEFILKCTLLKLSNLRKSLLNNKSYILWPIDNTYNMLDFWNNNYKFEIVFIFL